MSCSLARQTLFSPTHRIARYPEPSQIKAQALLRRSGPEHRQTASCLHGVSPNPAALSSLWRSWCPWWPIMRLVGPGAPPEGPFWLPEGPPGPPDPPWEIPGTPVGMPACPLVLCTRSCFSKFARRMAAAVLFKYSSPAHDTQSASDNTLILNPKPW